MESRSMALMKSLIYWDTPSPSKACGSDDLAGHGYLLYAYIRPCDRQILICGSYW